MSSRLRDGDKPLGRHRARDAAARAQGFAVGVWASVGPAA